MTARFTAAGTWLLAIWVGMVASVASAQEADTEATDYRGGKNFIPTKVYSEQDDQRILKLFQGLRVADVSDGMDRAGLQNIGLVDAEIRPLWRDTEHFQHRFVGILVFINKFEVFILVFFVACNVISYFKVVKRQQEIQFFLV